MSTHNIFMNKKKIKQIPPVTWNYDEILRLRMINKLSPLIAAVGDIILATVWPPELSTFIVPVPCAPCGELTIATPPDVNPGREEIA